MTLEREYKCSCGAEMTERELLGIGKCGDCDVESEYDNISEKKRQVKEDKVNHPPHYNQHPSGVECLDIVEHMTFNAGNAVKYIWRADLKHGGDLAIEDFEKAVFYLKREIERRLKQK